MEKQLKKSKGFTLIEILIALAIMSIVTTAIYQLYISQYKTWVSQDITVEMQQSARFAMDTMTREMQLIGYDVPSAFDAIEIAGEKEFKFRSKDESIECDPTVAGDCNKRIREITFKYDVDNKTLKMIVGTWNGTTFNAPTTATLAESITGMTFEYYNVDGDETTVKDDIRRVRISFTAETLREDPITKSKKSMTLVTEIRPRNLGIGETSSDSTPPSRPTGIVVVDPGRCGTLRIKWTPNSEIDLSGYIIYYGLSSGPANYTQKVNVSASAANSYELTGLSNTLSNSATPSMYYIAIVAYDSSGNASSYSNEAFGNPSPSRRSFDSGAGNDTTINLDKPLPPAGFKGVSVDEDNNPLPANQVRLVWTNPNNPNVIGYRIFRSTTPFTFGSYPPGGTGVTQLAAAPGEGFEASRTRNSDDTSYTDKDSANLHGCQVYYYAIIPVSCDSTLISYDAGDDNTKRGVSTDYAVTYGDGGTDDTQQSGSAGVADEPDTSDTAPGDQVAPGSPIVTGRAGWRRVAISVTNPVDSDFAKTCLYVEKSGVEGSPGLDDTKDANGCFNVAGLDPDWRRLVPDAAPATNPDGIFTNASLTTFWHDSMTLRAPTSPSLAQAGQEVQTYAYKAVSFDKCGNPGTPADATSATTVATTNLCGEDPEGKPPAPSLPAVPATACTQPVPLSQSVTVYWTPVPSDVTPPNVSSPDNPWDLAGYRIFRSNTADFGSATLLNPEAPLWCEGACSYTDNSVAEGETYYYRVASTDCPYEKDNPSTAAIVAAMNSNTIHSVLIGPVTPGQIVRDEKCPGGGSCIKDSHREILTGVSLDGSNNSSPSSDMTHNTVTIFFENNSAGIMTIERATAYWLNSIATLTKVTVGGGRSGLGLTTTVLSAVSGTDNDITDAQIPGKKRYVPITFEFKDGGGIPVDMRGDQLRVVLNVKNESTGTTTCLSYLTTNTPQILDDIVLPVGPSVIQVKQNPPATALGSPTESRAVPGSGETANTVPSGSDGPVVAAQDNWVSINAQYQSNTTGPDGNKLPITLVTLYYKATDKTITVAPTSGYETQIMCAGWCGTSGTAWGWIPPQNEKRLWFYIVVEDQDGNYDRGPAKEHGAYTYDHATPDPCLVTPYMDSSWQLWTWPGSSTADAVANTVTLQWSPSNWYTNWTWKYDSDTFYYRVYRRDSFTGEFSRVSAGGCAGDIECTSWPCTCTDSTASGLDVNNNNSYYVKVVNSCDPANNMNLSGPSNIYTECAGVGGGTVLSVDRTSMQGWDWFMVTVNDCGAAANGGWNDVLNNLNITTASGRDVDVISVNEGDAGIYQTWVSAYPSTTNCDTWDSYLGPWGWGYLCVANSDTITVSLAGASGSPQTIAVSPNPCTNTPNAPSGLNLLIDGATKSVRAANTRIHVKFTAPQTNTDASELTDLDHYVLTVTKNAAQYATINIPLTSCTSSSANPAAGATCDYTYNAGAEMEDFVWGFSVKAADACSIESAEAGPLSEACTGSATCNATY